MPEFYSGLMTYSSVQRCQMRLRCIWECAKPLQSLQQDGRLPNTECIIGGHTQWLNCHRVGEQELLCTELQLWGPVLTARRGEDGK